VGELNINQQGDVSDANSRIDKAVRKSYYNKTYAKDYYKNNKETILNRSKSRWAEMSDVEKQAYYDARKQKRKLKKKDT